jgi:hypothetical protein
MTASRVQHMIDEPDAFKGLQKCIVNFCLKQGQAASAGAKRVSR